MQHEDKAEGQRTGGMLDISHKAVTGRRAVARSTIKLGARAFEALVDGKNPKGDVLETAKVAGVMAAKATPQVIPLCHPLELSKVKIQHELNSNEKTVSITAEVVYHGRTGVEMEALTAVSVAALTIYDMLKWADKGMVITETRLLHKSGGKSGDYDFNG
ncbi:MAG: cyclic pyranopterin monophosphate synthase MoaC [Candidatus Omnitrophica bacterium]|nr:cyclic pyranopterin monophosphate synthase MoaC [Candidatus Omnitrophota bacterium]